MMISQEMDRPLSTRQRLALRFHLLLCGACRAYRNQLALIRRALRDQFGGVLDAQASSMSLSENARNRILAEIKRASA